MKLNMKKTFAVVVATFLSLLGFSDIYQVATTGCISVRYRSFQSLACGFDGYAHGFALVACGLIFGVVIWFWKNKY